MLSFELFTDLCNCRIAVNFKGLLYINPTFALQDFMYVTDIDNQKLHIDNCNILFCVVTCVSEFSIDQHIIEGVNYKVGEAVDFIV